MWRCVVSHHIAHIVQPLDHIPFAFFKAEYQRQLLWLNRLLCGHRMARIQFFRVLVPAYTTAMTEAIRSRSHAFCFVQS